MHVLLIFGRRAIISYPCAGPGPGPGIPAPAYFDGGPRTPRPRGGPTSSAKSLSATKPNSLYSRPNNEGTSKLSEKTDLLCVCDCHCPRPSRPGGPHLGSQVSTMVKLHDRLSSVTREIVKSGGLILHPFLSTSGAIQEGFFKSSSR